MRTGIRLAALLATALVAHPRVARAQADEEVADELAEPDEVATGDEPREPAAPPPHGVGEGPTTEEPGSEVPAFRWPGLLIWEVHFRFPVPPQTAFDRSLLAHGYGDVRVVPTASVSLTTSALAEWLWVGGQLGVRGRTWSHAERDAAALLAIDAVVKVGARALLGQVVELGVSLAGGLGWIALSVAGVTIDRAVPRFTAQGDLAFRVGRRFAFGPRIGWDYFEWGGVNAYGHGVDAGGPYFGLSLEGRE